MNDADAVVRLRAAIEALLECRESDGDEAEGVVNRAYEALEATRANVEPVLYWVRGHVTGSVPFYVKEQPPGEILAGIRETATSYPLREARAMALKASEQFPRIGFSIVRAWEGGAK